MSKFQGNVFDSDGDGNSVVTFAEDDLDGQALIAARKKTSEIFSSISTLREATGIHEACDRLNEVEALKKKGRVKFDPDEIEQMLRTISEAAQLSEWEQEKGIPFGQKPRYKKVREFKCSAWKLELYFRREQMPAHLAPKIEKLPPDLAVEKRRLLDSLTRSWQRKWHRLHLVLCYIHLALASKREDPAATSNTAARLFTDQTTDLLTEIRRAGKSLRGEPKARYRKVVDAVLKKFRADKEHIFSPEWKFEEYRAKYESSETAPEDETEADQKNEPDPQKVREKAMNNFTVQTEALLVGLSDDERDVRIDEMHNILEVLRNGDDPRGGKGRVPNPPLVAVIQTSDRVLDFRSKNDGFVASTAEDSANLLSKTEDSSEFITTDVSYSQPSPEDEARMMIYACSSVNATMYKAAFTARYPLKGLAAELPPDERSYPRRKGETATATELIAQIPEFIRRNREQQHNVAVRVWGPWFQVDDCTLEFYERLKPFCFAAVQTSPKSYNVLLAFSSAFVGLDGKRNDDLLAVRKRFFERCKELGESANGGAYGSIRMPGTLNIKEKYLGNFPLIRLAHTSMGRLTTPEELDAADLLAPAPVQKLTLVNPMPRPRNILAAEPDYHYYVNRAPAKEDGSPNLNSADESYVIRLLSLGNTRAEAGAKLRAVRDKAARRPDYVEMTLDAAERWRATHSTSDRERMAI